MAVLGIVGVLAAGTWFQYRLSRGRIWTPLWLAFSATAASIVFVVAGLAGYRLGRRSLIEGQTSGWLGVISWEVGAGLLCAVVAAFAWRRALRPRTS